MHFRPNLFQISGLTHFCITPINCATHANDTPPCCYLHRSGRITAFLALPLFKGTEREGERATRRGDINGGAKRREISGTGRLLPTCGLKAIYRRNKLINYGRAPRIRSDQSIKYPGTTASVFSDTRGIDKKWMVHRGSISDGGDKS